MTIAVDFDGVIHAYSKGWGDGSIYDEPVPRAFYALHLLMHTTRNPKQVSRWIESRSGYGIECTTRTPRTWLGRVKPFWNERGILLVTNHKLAATSYIDDRARRFTSWEDMFEQLGMKY